jgi:hypothetical protein
MQSFSQSFEIRVGGTIPVDRLDIIPGNGMERS